MTQASDVEKAEKLGRRRARMFIFQGLIFLIWQTTFFTTPAAEPFRTVDHVRLSAWLVWALVLCLLLATGGGLLRSRAVRSLLDDELTRSHRARACVIGFWMAVASGLLLYVVGMFEDVTAREAIHIILSVGIGSAIFSFGISQRRAYSDA